MPFKPFTYAVQTSQKRLPCRSKRFTTSRLRRSRIVLLLCRRRRRHHIRSRRSRRAVRTRIRELELNCTVIFAEDDPGGVLHDVLGTDVRVYGHMRSARLVVRVLVEAHRGILSLSSSFETGSREINCGELLAKISNALLLTSRPQTSCSEKWTSEQKVSLQ